MQVSWQLGEALRVPNLAGGTEKLGRIQDGRKKVVLLPDKAMISQKLAQFYYAATLPQFLGYCR